MKCAILYCSQHHQNTEKLVKHIAASHPEATPISLFSSPCIDWNEYALIGFASGIYMGKPHRVMLDFIQSHSAELKGKKICSLLTSGSNQAGYGKRFSAFLSDNGCHLIGSYQCKGFDTYGPWKLIGGIAKGHPNAQEISDADAFIRQLLLSK